MTNATPNANFQSLSGTSVHERTDPLYREYRRQWLENARGFILRDFPLHLDVEITNRCNLRCTFCDKLPLLSPDQMGDMDCDLFRRILDEGREHQLWGLKLSYRGEPLLHPRVPEMVAYAKKSGVLDVYFNTNGMLLSEKAGARLIEAGLDRVSISVEGTDPETFEQARVGAKYDLILRNVDRLMELKARKKVSHPKVRIQTVALPGMDLAEYARFWSAHADEVAAIDYKAVLDRDETLIGPDWACPQLWQRMTVEWDGTIMPCNNDDFRRMSPGNVRQKTVRECWHAEIVVRARQAHREGRSHEVGACNGCPWRTTQIKKLDRNSL